MFDVCLRKEIAHGVCVLVGQINVHLVALALIY